MDAERRFRAPGVISPCDRIRRTNAAGAQYWSRRDLARVLDYSDHRNFEQAMRKSQTACFNSGRRIEDHFVEITEMIAEGIRKLEPRATGVARSLEPSPCERDAIGTSREKGGM